MSLGLPRVVDTHWGILYYGGDTGIRRISWHVAGGRITLTQVTESLTVLEAVGVYAGSLRPKDGEQTEAHKQLLRFVSWCGAERRISEIAPAEIGEYSDQSNGGTQSAERLQEVKKFLAFASKQGLTEQTLPAICEFARRDHEQSRPVRTSGAPPSLS